MKTLTTSKTMKNFIVKFCSLEDGAITVDWVVLTAAIVGLGTGVILTVGTGTDSVANAAADRIGTHEIGVPD